VPADIGLVDDFARLASSADTEFEMALLVARFIEPEFDVTDAAATLDSVFASLQQQQCEDLPALLGGLTRLGFGRQPLRRVNILHSHIGWVIQHKQGLPISLAVVLIECARRLSLPSYGINFPGHFLVQVGDALVDPLRMERVSMAQLDRSGLTGAEQQQFLQPASAQALGLRMLNNLKTVFTNAQDWHRVLDVLDCQLALTGTDRGMAGLLHFERGETWERAGVASVARDAYQACLHADISSAMAGRATARIAALDGRDETLH
jgi:regulator of sirC expression with transglutaminase-like and TPR domain